MTFIVPKMDIDWNFCNNFQDENDDYWEKSKVGMLVHADRHESIDRGVCQSNKNKAKQGKLNRTKAKQGMNVLPVI